jgi:GNAT superfamily N-acetyltransferase
MKKTRTNWILLSVFFIFIFYLLISFAFRKKTIEGHGGGAIGGHGGGGLGGRGIGGIGHGGGIGYGGRGLGLGRHLITECLQLAANFGYQQVYLESMPELKDALKTYEKFGFKYLDAPLGDTGHFGCGLWMLKSLIA